MKYRKKPCVVEAFRVGDVPWRDLEEWCRGKIIKDGNKFHSIRMKTIDGNYAVSEKGDWIVKGVNGEFYPCKPDIFEKTYEPVK